MEQYLQITGSSYQQLVEQVKPQAEERVRSRLVLEAVAKAEKLEATEEDYEEELKTMAEVYQMEADKVKELMRIRGALCRIWQSERRLSLLRRMQKRARQNKVILFDGGVTYGFNTLCH